MSVPDPVGPRIQPAKIDYQELWQYFESRGSELKGTMLQVSTLLIGFAAAVVGYAVDKSLDFKSSQIVHDPPLLLLLSVVGIAIVLYAEVTIREFGEHIIRNFDRANCTRIGDRSLDEILACGGSATKKLPNICLTVRSITRAFGVAFALGAVMALVSLVILRTKSLQ